MTVHYFSRQKFLYERKPLIEEFPYAKAQKKQVWFLWELLSHRRDYRGCFNTKKELLDYIEGQR